MTTVSLLLGMLPVALALGEGGEARAPMAVCVMGGMIASTMLTLVIVPVIYTLFDALSNSRLVGFLGRKVFVANGEAKSDATTQKFRYWKPRQFTGMPSVADHTVA